MNRYPRRASVSTKRGLEAESFSASRILFTAVFRLWSKSTKVSAGQIFCRRSSRVTTRPAFSTRAVENLKGLLLQPDAHPLLAQFARRPIDFKDAKPQKLGCAAGRWRRHDFAPVVYTASQSSVVGR